MACNMPLINIAHDKGGTGRSDRLAVSDSVHERDLNPKKML